MAAFKGGVAKTTTAVHLAAVCQDRGSTLLVDSDLNRSATAWRARGKGFPFELADSAAGASIAHRFKHVVIDTQARPNREDLKDLADSCDLVIVPTAADAMALDALMQTVELLDSLNRPYRILLTMVPPKPNKVGDEVQTMLRHEGWPVFKTYIRRLVAFQKAALLGCLVKDVSDPRAPLGWSDYVAVGKEMLR